MSVEELVDDESLELLTNQITGARNVNLLRLQSPPPGMTASLDPFTLSAFGGQNYVVVRNSTKETSGFNRFLVLHELGHATKAAAFARERVILGRGATLLLILWTGCLLHWTIWLGAAWIALCALVVLLRLRVDLLSDLGLMASEINADRFALNNLNAGDLEKTLRLVMRCPPARDSRMGRSSIAIRCEQFVYARERLSRGEKLQLLEVASFPTASSTAHGAALVLLGLLPQHISLTAIQGVLSIACFALGGVVVHQFAIWMNRKAHTVIRSRITESECSADRDMQVLIDGLKVLVAVISDEGVRLIQSVVAALDAGAQGSPNHGENRDLALINETAAHIAVLGMTAIISSEGALASKVSAVCDRSLTAIKRLPTGDRRVVPFLLHAMALADLCVGRRVRAQFRQNECIRLLTSQVSEENDAGVICGQLKSQFQQVSVLVTQAKLSLATAATTNR